MAYEKLNLADGQKFTAAHVAHIEDGIENAGTFTVNVTVGEGGAEYNADKTFAEIEAALVAGRYVHAAIDMGEEGKYYLPAVAWLSGTHIAFILYAGSLISVFVTPNGIMMEM